MFTQNQIRQFLPVSAYQSSTMVGGTANIGKVKVTSTPEGEYNVQYVDSTGRVISFLIPASNILWKKATPASKMAYTSKATLITLVDPDGSGSTFTTSTGFVVPGQDYMLNIRINGLYWDSDEVWGHKYGVVRGTAGMTDSDFYKKMAKSLALNFLREPAGMLKFYVTTADFSDSETVVFTGGSANVTEVTATTNLDSLEDTYTGIVIDEAEQPWRLGVMPQHGVDYIVSTPPIYVNSNEMAWGEVTTLAAGGLTVGNGKKVADMEWHYHGERGDYNREAAWPMNYDYHYQIDPTKTYDIIDIHYSWIGNNHAIQRSEKDLTLAFDSTSHTEVNKFLTAWNNAGDVNFSASSLNTTILN